MSFDYTPPKYAQVVAEIQRRIADGRLRSRARCCLRNISSWTDFGVSRPTIVKALSALRQDGWIETQQGRGSFVRGRRRWPGHSGHGPRRTPWSCPKRPCPGELVQAGVKLAPAYVTTLLGLERGRESVPSATAAERGRRDAGRAGVPLAAAGARLQALTLPRRSCSASRSATISRCARSCASTTRSSAYRRASRPEKKRGCSGSTRTRRC